MNNFDNLIIKSDECSICFNLIKKEIILNCNHYFCDNCIKEWVKRSNLCPMCRTQINFYLFPELIAIVNNRKRFSQIQNTQTQNTRIQNTRIQNNLKIRILLYFLTFLLLFYILLKIFEQKMNDNDKNLNYTIENYHYNNDNHY